MEQNHVVLNVDDKEAKIILEDVMNPPYIAKTDNPRPIISFHEYIDKQNK
jgi:hypothetical protein